MITLPSALLNPYSHFETNTPVGVPAEMNDERKEKTQLAPPNDSDAKVIRVHEIQYRRQDEEPESALEFLSGLGCVGI
jgi:hypothetical protein